MGAGSTPDAVEQVWPAFRDAVNMTGKQLASWLETDESKDAGQKDGDGESTGHASGRRIVTILSSRKSELDDDDAAHMHKVVAYVHRHLGQRPDKSDRELEHTRWTASLKNWGHDPLA